MNLAVLEMNNTTFLTYTALLAISGVIMVVLAIVGFGASTGSRILSGILGVGFFGYAVYLTFISDDDTVIVFYYAFIAPILLIVNVFKSRKAAKEGLSAPQQPAA